MRRGMDMMKVYCSFAAHETRVETPIRRIPIHTVDRTGHSRPSTSMHAKRRLFHDEIT